MAEIDPNRRSEISQLLKPATTKAPEAPAKEQSVLVPGADTPVEGKAFRPTVPRAPDAGLNRKLDRNLWGAARATEQLTLKAMPKITAGDALTRLKTEHEDFASNREKLQAAFNAKNV